MTPRPDPRREPEDSIPVPGVPGMKTPGREPKTRWHDNWTPDQMVKALAMLLGTLVTTFATVLGLIGGKDAFLEIVTSGKATRTAIAASEKSIKEAIKTELDASLAIERKERDKLSARLIIAEKQVDFVAGFAAALNRGKPHPSVPTDSFVEAKKPTGEAKKPPTVVTDSPWPKRDD